MKIFKLIAGIIILFTLFTAFFMLWPMLSGDTFTEALIFVGKFYGFLAIVAGFACSLWFGAHLVASYFEDDSYKSDDDADDYGIYKK